MPGASLVVASFVYGIGTRWTGLPFTLTDQVVRSLAELTTYWTCHQPPMYRPLEPYALPSGMVISIQVLLKLLLPPLATVMFETPLFAQTSDTPDLQLPGLVLPTLLPETAALNVV